LNYTANILDYADYAHDKLMLRHEQVNIRKELDKAHALYSRQIRAQQIRYLTHISPTVPKSFLSDRRRMRQILINSLGLAVRYTQAGVVSLSLTNTSSQLQIKLADTGTGLPYPTKPKSLLAASRDSDKACCDSGLELATSYVLVEALGGRMKVTSRPHEGTTIEISLPLHGSTGRSGAEHPTMPCMPPSPRRHLTAPPLAPGCLDTNKNETHYNVLVDPPVQLLPVVEEEKDTPLQPLSGHSDRGMGNGTSHLQQVVPDSSVPEQEESKETLQLMCDAETPAHSFGVGVGVASQDQSPNFSHTININSNIGASASLNVDMKENTDLEGQRHTRDLSIDQLSCSCPRVLIVDDSELNLFVAEKLVRKCGLTCAKVRTDYHLQATNGREAVNMATQAGVCAVCHGFLITFMDCSMPIMNGYVATQHLVALMNEGKIRRMPIVATTAFKQAECWEDCHAAGMVDYGIDTLLL
jgi:CheY-like chemotaxis protein